MRCRVVGAGEGESLTVVGDVLTFKLGASDTNERFVLGEVLVAPGGGPPPHLHEREDELFYVVDGQMDFSLNDTTWPSVMPGRAVWAPRNVPHAFRNTGQTPLRALVIATPCNFEKFYRECGKPFALGQPLPERTHESIQKLLTTASKFGLRIMPEHQFPMTGQVGDESSRWVLGELVTFKLTSNDTAGNFCVSSIASRPGGGPPAHLHRAEDEVFYILEGKYEFLLGDRAVAVGPGTTAFVPRGTVHFYKNVGQTTGRLVSIHTPGGFERFFEEAGEPCTDPNSPPAVDLARIAPLITKHGMELPGQ